MNKVSLRMRLDAAAHELTCWECRVTWQTWLQRLLGMRGYSPKIPCSRCRKKFGGLELLINPANGKVICRRCAKLERPSWYE